MIYLRHVTDFWARHAAAGSSGFVAEHSDTARHQLPSAHDASEQRRLAAATRAK
jgi:hypothetical protein